MNGAYGILYAEDFEDPEPVPEPPAPVFSLSERDDHAAEACRAAVASARADWVQSDQYARTAALTALSDAFARLQAETLQQQAALAAETAQTMLAVLAAMLPALGAQHGPAEVSALLQVVLPRLQQEPRVTVAVAPEIVALVRPDLALFDDPVSAALTLVADRRLAPGDLRLTWPGGSLVRDTASIAAAVRTTIEAMLPPLPRDPAPTAGPAMTEQQPASRIAAYAH